KGDQGGAQKAYADFVARFPGDPLRPTVELELGRIGVALGQAKEAREHLKAAEAAPELSRSARFWGAIADAQLGACAGAETTLRPLDGKLETEPGVILVGALAECWSKGGSAAALPWLARLWDVGAEHEKRYAWGRAEELAAKLPADDAIRGYDTSPPGSFV